jgi:hypothetical protein
MMTQMDGAAPVKKAGLALFTLCCSQNTSLSLSSLSISLASSSSSPVSIDDSQCGPYN